MWHFMRAALSGCACFISFCLSAQQLKVNVSAPSAILVNAETGAILYEKSAHTSCYPASVTKIATALYVLEKKGRSLDEIVTATEDAVVVVPAHVREAPNSRHPSYRLETRGTHMSLKAGEQMPLRALLYGLLLVSGNDAANAMAQHVSGSIPHFMEELNAYLKQKGIRETSFANPHGLHSPNHYTTAFDMALITREALKHPMFKEMIKTVRYTRPETNKQPASPLVQHNRLVKPGPCYYANAIGGKTGFHSRAGYNLVAAAQKEGRTLIAVLLGGADPVQRYKDATQLFEAAFAETKMRRTLFNKEFSLFSCQIKGGKNVLEAGLMEDITLDYYPAEEPELKAFLNWKELALPIAQGELVGEVQLKTPSGELFKQIPLYARKDVEKTTLFQFQECLVRVENLLLSKSAILLELAALTALVIFLYHRRSKAFQKKQ